MSPFVGARNPVQSGQVGAGWSAQQRAPGISLPSPGVRRTFHHPGNVRVLEVKIYYFFSKSCQFDPLQTSLVSSAARGVKAQKQVAIVEHPTAAGAGFLSSELTLRRALAVAGTNTETQCAPRTRPAFFLRHLNSRSSISFSRIDPQRPAKTLFCLQN